MKTWKVQKFASDVVYDLRSRGLLPLAIMLVIAMIAVPLFVIRPGVGGSSAPAAASPAATAELAPENQAAVLAYAPGLRDYKKRLGDLAEKDPFKQQFTVPEAATSALEGTGGATGTTGDSGGTNSTGSSEGTGGGTTGGGDSGNETSGGKGSTRFYRYEADVETGEAGGDMDRKNGVEPFTYLPGEEAPVLVYLGTSFDKRATFLVNKEVLSADGSGECIPAADSCQLLTLEQGESEDLVWGVDGKTYRIKVLKVKLKVSKKLPKK